MLYPQKNLIPPFNDSGWFQDVTVAGGTLNVDAQNPHKATFVITTSAQGRLIWIPVTMGKTYTISFKNITGYYRVYKGKATNHDDNIWLNKSNNGSYTFKVDPTYKGFVTLRITYGMAGSYVFENLQLEEGELATDFKPYKLENKPLARRYGRKNLIDINDSRWTLRSGTTYVTRSGSRMVWDSSADYGGVQIMLNDADFIGKTITFGGKRHPDTGVLFFYKKPDGSASYVGLATNEAYRTLSIPYGSSECRFYVQNNSGSRSAAFWSEDLFIYYGTENVYTPYREGAKTPSFAYNKISDITTEIGNFIIDSGVKAPNVTAIRSKDFTAIQPNTFVRVIADRKALTGGSTRIFEYDSQYQFIRSNLSSAVTTHPNTRYIMFHSIMASEGVNAAMKFAYANDKPAILPASIYPKKNLVKPFTSSDWQLHSNLTVLGGYDATLTASTAGWDSSKTYVNVEVGKPHMVQAVITGGFSVEVWENGKNLGAHVKSSFQSRVTTPTYPVWEIRLVRDGQATGTMTIKDLMISQASEKGTFEPYKFNANKAPKLYPQKNLLPSFSQWQYSNEPTKLTFNSDYKMTMAADAVGIYHNHHVPVEKGKTYTCSIGSLTANARVAIREVKANNSKVFAINLTSDSKTFTITPAIDTVKLEFDCTVQAVGTLVFENPMIEEGSKATSFAPYKLGNKPL
jgi:hypothetical protein